jgi:hypothetical protein
VIVAGAVALFSARAQAQSERYHLEDINFDMWCQEEQHLPPDRCDRRLPGDDAAFAAYVDKIETYEIQNLQRKEKEENLNQVIIHSDPIDHPSEIPGPQVNIPGPPN